MKTMRSLVVVLLYWCTTALADFSTSYAPPQTAENAVVAGQLQQSQFLEKFASGLSRFVQVPGDLPIVAGACGQVNAYYTPQQRRIIICYELLSHHLAQLNKRYKDPSVVAKILQSELAYTLLHEVGHALFDIYRIPVLGKEEDAADAFAAFILLSTNGDAALQNAPFYMPLSKIAWYTKMLHGSAVYGDEHALSEQRLANMVCWGFGKDPQGFRNAAIAAKLPQHRAERCASEYAKLTRDMQGLLGDKLALGQPNSRSVAQAPSGPTPPAPSAASTQDMIAMLDHYKCGGCHTMDSRKIGPGFREVARRYRGTDVVQQLIYTLKVGSVGVWGEIPSPPQHSISEYDAEAMVRWILSL